MEFDACTLYTLVRLGGWPGLDSADVQAARHALLGARVSEVPARMRTMAATGMPRAIVPFRRDELDVACAAVLADVCGDAEFASDGVLVDAGYFSLRSREVVYVDEVQRQRTPQTRLLEPERVQSLLQTMQQLPRQWAHLEVPAMPEGGDAEHGAELLHVVGPWLAPCLDEPGPHEATLWLVQPGTDQGPVLLPGHAQCVWQGGALAVRVPQAELVMELQAASLHGAWLMVRFQLLSCLGPLPDLLTPGARRAAWCQPAWLYRQGLGAWPHMRVPLDADVAQRIVRHVPWAWIQRLSEFHALASDLDLTARTTDGAPAP